MNSLAVSIWSSLRAHTKRKREQSERELIESACSGVAILLSCASGLALFEFGEVVVGGVTYLVARVLLPVSKLVAKGIFDALSRSWRRSEDELEQERYLRAKLDQATRLVNDLPLPDADKHKYTTQLYQKYLTEIDLLQERIKRLTE